MHKLTLVLAVDRKLTELGAEFHSINLLRETPSYEDGWTGLWDSFERKESEAFELMEEAARCGGDTYCVPTEPLEKPDHIEDAGVVTTMLLPIKLHGQGAEALACCKDAFTDPRNQRVTDLSQIMSRLFALNAEAADSPDLSDLVTDALNNAFQQLVAYSIPKIVPYGDREIDHYPLLCSSGQGV